MHGQQQEGPDWGSPIKDFKNSVNMTVAAAQGLAGPVEAILRRPGTAGAKYFAAHAAFGYVAMFLIIALAGGPHAGEVAFGAAGVVAFFLALHKSQREKAEKCGVHVHSRYSGVPWIPGKDELRIKGFSEPVLAIFAGVCAIPLSHGLAIYLIIAGIALSIAYSAQQAEWDARKRSIRDAMEEQRIMQSMMQDIQRESLN